MDTTAVFDTVWHAPDAAPAAPLLAVAGGDGAVHVHRVEGSSCHTCELVASAPLQPATAGAAGAAAEAPLCTSVDWDRQPAGRGAAPNGDRLAACGQDGRVHVLHAGPATLALACSWQGHALEAWVARWDWWRPHVLYSGGDDSVFCACAPQPAPRRAVPTPACVCAALRGL